MIDLNNVQINAVTSLIFSEISKKVKEKEEKFLNALLNNSEFIEAYKKFNDSTKRRKKLEAEAKKLSESAFNEFMDKFPTDYFADRRTLKAAAKSHARFVSQEKESSIKKSDIKDKVALYSIGASTIEDIKNSIINLYEKE